MDQEVESPDLFLNSWAVYPGNTTEKLCEEVLVKLSQLYNIGHIDKKRKISPDRSLNILIDEIISADWAQKLIISVPRINDFFT